MACCLMQQAITWTNVDLSSARSRYIHLRGISQEIPQPLIIKFSLKFTHLKFHTNLSGANTFKGLTNSHHSTFCYGPLGNSLKLLPWNGTRKLHQHFSIRLVFQVLWNEFTLCQYVFCFNHGWGFYMSNSIVDTCFRKTINSTSATYKLASFVGVLLFIHRPFVQEQQAWS